MPVVVPAPRDISLLAQILPCSLQRRDRPGRVVRAWLPEREHVPFGPDLAETLRVPFRIGAERFVQDGIQWNGSAFTSLSLAMSNREKPPAEVDLAPSQRLHFRVAH